MLIVPLDEISEININKHGVVDEIIFKIETMKDLIIGDFVQVKEGADNSFMFSKNINGWSKYKIINIALMFGQDKKVIQILDDNNDEVWLELDLFESGLSENMIQAKSISKLCGKRTQADFESIKGEEITLIFNSEMKITDIRF